MEKRTVTAYEAAEILGVHVLTVRKAIAKGELRAIRIGRKVLIPTSVLDEFLAGKASA